MTCIVGIASEGHVHMGGDSCASDHQSWQIVGDPKVFKVQDRFLFGVCGMFRVLDLLRYSLDVPGQPDTMKEDRFMRTIFIDAVRETLKQADPKNLNFLVGYRGNLYEVQPDYSVLTAPQWGHSVGSGHMPARGVLYDTRRSTDWKDRLQRALEAAEATTPSVRGPFHFDAMTTHKLKAVA